MATGFRHDARWRDPAILRTEMLYLDPRHSGMAALLATQSLSDR
jgi:hypothetical protein